MAIQEQQTVEMLKAILGTIDEGIHAVNAQGVTIYYNDVAASLDGLEPSEVIGKHVLDVFPSLRKETSTLLRVIQTGEPIYHTKQDYTTVRGHRVHTVNTTLPIRVAGELVGALEVAKDLTGIRELTEKLIDLQAKFVATDGNRHRQSPMAARYTFDDIITEDATMQRLKEMAARAAATPSSVLVYGETGTGKELFVHAIHAASPRRKQPLIAQNCAALPVTLLESLLFGTVKGSFTGAENRPGLFELADGGTLFLDEIHAMPLELQAKLLRVIQDGWIRRVGDAKEKVVDVRIIVATNMHPLEAVQKGLIRADLFYRINTVSLFLPRLSERPRDIPLLTWHFIQQCNQRLGRHIESVEPAVEKRFLTYSWPGNVRELAHAIEGAMNMADGTILEEHLLPWPLLQVELPNHSMPLFADDAGTGSGKVISQESDQLPAGMNLPDVLQSYELLIIQRALKECGGNVKETAKRLGIPRQTLQYKIKILLTDS